MAGFLSPTKSMSVCVIREMQGNKGIILRSAKEFPMVAAIVGFISAVVALFNAINGVFMAGQAVYDFIVVPVLWVVGM